MIWGSSLGTRGDLVGPLEVIGVLWAGIDSVPPPGAVPEPAPEDRLSRAVGRRAGPASRLDHAEQRPGQVVKHSA